MLGSLVAELGTQAFISFLKLFFTCRTSHTSMGTTSHCWNESCFPPCMPHTHTHTHTSISPGPLSSFLTHTHV